MSILSRLGKRVVRDLHVPMERAFRAIEHGQMSRGAVLEWIPYPADRTGGLGTTTYAEWCYTVGIFQSLIFQYLPAAPVRMLDVGCGAGRLYLAVKPYLGPDGTYLGIDVDPAFIERCRRLYPVANARFMHTEASNGYYAPGVALGPKGWPIEDGAHNLVTALSVWTHLREEDWRFYLREVSRILSPGGRAIISFFITDDLYHPESKSSAISAYYPQPENRWIFDASAYGSAHWTYPSWASVPEVATGVDKAQFLKEVEEAGLDLVSYMPGQWKDQPGFFFQDVAVFQKR